MKALFLFLTISLSLGSIQRLMAQNEATAVVKIDNLTLDEYNDIADRLNKDNVLEMEYHCLQSGVLVIKAYNHSFSDKADVQTLILRKITSVVSKDRISVLDVESWENNSSSKC